MYTYKIYNNIADDGIEILAKNNLHIDEINPDSLLIRSQVLTDSDLNKSLKCIGRAGAGTNNVPVEDATKKGSLFLIHLELMQMLSKSLWFAACCYHQGALFRAIVMLNHLLVKIMHCLTLQWSPKRKTLKEMS